MSGTGETIDRAEAAIVDAAAETAAQAQTAVDNAAQHAAHIAATATEVAQERTEELREQVQETVQQQEDNLAWLRDHATATASHLTGLTERQNNLETGLGQLAERTQAGFQAILDRLTPPPLPETQTSPESLPKEGAEGRKAAEEKPKPEKRHRWT